MRTTPGRRFALLVSLPPAASPDSSPPAERALNLIDAIEHAGAGSVPIAWHLPAADATAGRGTASAGFRDALRRRVEEHGDTLLPMGLTGAAHVALHIAEIEADLTWSVSNIWTTGVSDALRYEPPLIVPAGADTLRRDALAAYGSAAVPVGLLGEDSDGAWISVVPNGDGSAGRVLALVEGRTLAGEEVTARTLARALARRRRAARSLAGPDAPVVLRIALDEGDDGQHALALTAAACELAAQRGWTTIQAGAEAAAGGSVPGLLPAARPTMPPDAGERVTALRRRRGSKINTRRILEQVALERVATAENQTPHQAGSARFPDDGRREFIASMLGQASIPGTTVEARFDAGRLCGLHGRSTARRRDHPARSELVCGGRRTLETVTSCFSFETAISRGLRAEAVLEDGGAVLKDGLAVLKGGGAGAVARIRTEYAFVGEHDALVTGQHVVVERCSSDSLLYVLAAPVLRPGSCAVTGAFTDGTTYDVDLAFDREELVLWGEAFGIWDGESRYALVALGADNRPVTWCITALREPEPRIVLGGRYRARGKLDEYASLLLVRGEIDHELITKAMAGRLPPDITTELAAARASESRMRESITPQRQEA
ncbi:MAG: hypothetical protein ACOC2D_10850 [Spirochaetota bacterium]